MGALKGRQRPPHLSDRSYPLHYKGTMSDEPHADDHHPDEEETAYKPPPEKTLDEIVNQDQDDESLRKYKETLLGSSVTGGIIVDHNNPNRVLVRRLILVPNDKDEMVLDLTEGLDTLKDRAITIKEGISYKIRIEFHVQREIVTGLKYVQKTYTKGIQVDKMKHMVGSYAPKEDVQSYTTPQEDAPSGFMARGHYTVKSLFTDDDNNEHLKWEWSFDIKK